jgi:FtsZ-interacting cell division protein ZipA
MDLWLIAVIVIVIVIALVAVFATRSRRSTGSRQLKERFGTEYDRVAERTGDREQAERELAQRVERHERLEITALSPEQREHYVVAWRDVQRRFVDEPESTLGEADRLITQAMRDRGYPTEHFGQKIEDLSVDHAATIDAYREAHAIADRHEASGATTEELRRAMQHYRTVFEDIVGTQTTKGSDTP